MAQMKTQIGQLETKVDNVDNDVHISWFNWKFIGHGYQASHGKYVVKYHTTLQECVAFCIKKRQDSGSAWNGLDWDHRDGACCCHENDGGHTENPDYLHFRV